MNEDKKPLIIVLSGAQGVGKKTIAHQLGIDLQIMQTATLSCITKILQVLRPNDPVVKKWNVYDKKNANYIKTKLKREAKIIGKFISIIVEKATFSGENYILDGVQLLPEFLPMDKILFFYISAPNLEHKKRFSYPGITRLRHATNTSFTLVKKIDKIIRNECKSYSVHIINNMGNPKQVSKKIIKIIKKDHPDYRDKYLWFGKGN